MPANAYYATSHTFGIGTTSTLGLMIWRALSHHLSEHQQPMTGEKLAEATGAPIENIDNYFRQSYYQRHYGFRRFDSLEEWRTWAMENGVLYNPVLHDRPEEPEDEGDEDAAEDDVAVEAE